MARTIITPQSITQVPGAQVTFVPVDSVNGMQYRSTNREVVLISTGAGAGLSLNVPSLACSHNRLDARPIATSGVGVGAGTVEQFGPYDPSLYGDGSGNVLLNFTNTSGAGTQPLSVAVVLVN